MLEGKSKSNKTNAIRNKPKFILNYLEFAA
jgi:hypothetical protein